jgi:hypothetical protein
LAQALVWLWLFYAAVISIRQGDRGRHAHLMLAMAAVTTGAVWFRLATGTALVFDWPFDPVYAASAWLAWLVPLVLVRHYAERLGRWAIKSPPLAPGHSIS